MTCDEIRERLPEHVLGTIEGPEDQAIRRHVRGCAGCRKDMAALGEGLTLFSRAVHDVVPPDELQGHVRTVLQEEWHESSPEEPRASKLRWLAVAATILALVGSLAWGVAQSRRADAATEGAASYQRLLGVLGGEDFRVGELQPSDGRTVEGSVVVYDSHVDQSWAVVFVRVPGVEGAARATLHADDGRAIDLWDFTIDHGGDGAGWLVTSVDLDGFDRLTVTGPAGEALASADIVAA